MKLKNILSIFCFLTVMASCSMEDDTVMNDLGGIMETTGENVYLSVNIGTGTGTTKTSVPTTGSAVDKPSILGDQINRCILYLLDGNKVLAVADTVLMDAEGKAAPTTSLNMTFLTKVSKNDLTLVAVVNYDQSIYNQYLACSTLEALNGIRENYAPIRVMVGQVDGIKLTEGSPSTKDAPTTNVGTITVTPRVACIDLIGFNVKYKTEKHPEVKLTGIYYTNLKKNVGLFAEGENVFESGWQEDLNFFRTDLKQVYDSNGNLVDFPKGPLTIEDKEDGTGDCNAELSLNKSFFVAFPNTKADTPVQMKITFTVDGKEYDRTYTINRPTDSSFNNNTSNTIKYVNPGYWYRLKATVNISSNFVDCDVVCYTQDWIHNPNEDFIDIPVVKK